MRLTKKRDKPSKYIQIIKNQMREPINITMLRVMADGRVTGFKSK